MMNRRQLLRVSSISMILLGIFLAGCFFPVILTVSVGNSAYGMIPRGAADSPIVVNNDADWTGVPGITGDGSQGTPYIIKDKVIDAGGTGSGIWIGNTTSYFIISNCSVINSASQPQSGIHLTNVTRGLLIGNNCSYNAGAGILVERNCSHIYIGDNLVNENGYGIVLFSLGYNISIVHNTVTRNFAGRVGITVSMGYFINLTIAKNNASNNDWSGINIVTFAANVSIYDNYVANHTYGVHLRDGNTTYVWNNTLIGNTNGIYLESGNSYCKFWANNITGSTDGINVGECSFSEFEGNSISGNSLGFNWVKGNNNTLQGNNITDNTLYAIAFNPGGHNNTVFGNNLSLNAHGIWCIAGANMAKNNTVAFNSIKGNTGYAVSFLAGNNGNLVYGNNLSSGIGAADAGSWNRWDNGSVGNFWPDYAGVDANDDFVGDSAFTVPTSGAQDHYPIWDDGDDVAPVVSIMGLTVDQLCGGAAPSYGLTITDAYAVNDTWISYDNGLNNHTCGVGGTLPSWGDAGNGTVTITFYANDTGDNVGVASITIRKDVEPPIIASTGLTAMTSYTNAPSFALVITEGNLLAAWYSVDGGVTNYILTSLTSFVDAAAWASLPAGNVAITFWANDTLGNTGSVTIVVVKASSGEGCEDCGDPTLYYVIGGIIAIGAIVGIVVVVKRRKNRGFYPD